MRLRAGNRTAVAQRCQRLYTEVNANRCNDLGGRLYVVGLDKDRSEPAIGSAADRDALARTAEPDFLAHPDPADDRQLDPLAVCAERAGFIGGTKPIGGFA